MQNSDSIYKTSLELLEKLVSFDSVSCNSNLPIITFIEDYLKSHGITFVRAPSPDQNKTNLLARIGPEVAGGIVLSGHTDVVPVVGQSWDSPPFTLTERDGKLYGRGTSDMKTFIAVCLAMVPVFKQQKLAKPIWLAFSYDEEIGCLGAPVLLEYITKNIPKPSFAIIGEPTMMHVVTAHKGVLSFETTVTGLEAHSSQPHLGVNSVHVACDLVHFLNGMNADIRKSGTNDGRFMPPVSTVHVGTIHGGTARNIIPKECSFLWEIRPIPGEDPEPLVKHFSDYCADKLKEMRKTFDGANIATQPKSRMLGVSLPAEAQSSCQTVMHCAKTNQEHVVSFCTEAGVFQHHGVPSIICGPGSIDQAHKPNEFIDPSQIMSCVEFMFSLCDTMSGKTNA